MTVTDLPSIWEGDEEKVQYIIAGLLPKAAITALTGDSGSGKSTLATAWAREAAKQGIPVLILDRENPRSVIRDRLQRINFIQSPPFLEIWGLWVEQEPPLPDHLVILDWVKNSTPTPLVIVDSLIAFHAGDENDAKAMRTTMHRLRRLAALGAAVIVIHHDGKADSACDFRGSSDFKANLDAAFHVTNTGPSGRLDRLVLRPFKTRIPVDAVMYDYANGKMFRVEGADVRETASELLTTILRLNPGVGPTKFEELASQRGLSRNQTREFVSARVLAGDIRREYGQRNAKRLFLVVKNEPPDDPENRKKRAADCELNDMKGDSLENEPPVQ